MNGKVFRGYPTTAAAREGCAEVAELLVRAGASQPACEEAVVEAALQGQAALAAIFMRSDLVRPRVAVHALVSAAARGFVDVVDTLIKVLDLRIFLTPTWYKCSTWLQSRPVSELYKSASVNIVYYYTTLSHSSCKAQYVSYCWPKTLGCRMGFCIMKRRKLNGEQS